MMSSLKFSCASQGLEISSTGTYRQQAFGAFKSGHRAREVGQRVKTNRSMHLPPLCSAHGIAYSTTMTRKPRYKSQVLCGKQHESTRHANLKDTTCP